MAEQNEVVKSDLDFTSDQISNSTRYVGYGLVIAAFTILTSDGAFLKLLAKNYLFYIVGFAILGIITILFDYLQYILGYYSSLKANDNKDYKYSKKSKFYKLRYFFFYAKQVTSILGALVLIGIFLLAYITSN